ncbi:MAG: DUF2520 domain-containing protein [Lachnospiraceae bacterium]|nr:DUF2520 domain-containing protein [Lachnospiraceae bacterium]
MKVGFIGAGKMGFTLGKHMTDHGIRVGGYYSRTKESAMKAAEFTNSHCYDSLSELVNGNDIIFLTVPDGQIAVMANELDRLDVSVDEKIICHTSGASSSQVFSGMDSHVYGYSIHPIYAVSSKTESYINFNQAYITIEGHEKHIQMIADMFIKLGHQVKIISPDDKVKYHSAAVFASNLVIGLYHKSVKLMTECGFDEIEAEEALKPLFENNANNLINKGCTDALTGPVERCDTETVRKHVEVLEGDELAVYKLLSKELVEIADLKHNKSYDYDEMNGLLEL